MLGYLLRLRMERDGAPQIAVILFERPRAFSHYPGGWRCQRKSGQTKPSPKAVAGPPSRARMTYGPICSTTRRDEPIFQSRHRSSLADTRYASLLARSEERRVGKECRSR